MSAGDPSHDHAICGGTTSLAEAQRQMALMAEIFNISLTNKTKHVRLGFANARSGAVDFTKPMKILSERCIVYIWHKQALRRLVISVSELNCAGVTVYVILI